MGDGQDGVPDWPLEDYRGYLHHVLARLERDRGLGRQMEPSDLVQEVLLKAHQARDGFRGQSEGERKAWLRTILTNQVAAEIRRRGGRQVVSFQQAFEESSARLEAVLRVEESTPSQRAIRNERAELTRLALARLPEEQRLAIELHDIFDLTVEETGGQMGRTRQSVVGLLYRGHKKLKELLGDQLGT